MAFNYLGACTMSSINCIATVALYDILLPRCAVHLYVCFLSATRNPKPQNAKTLKCKNVKPKNLNPKTLKHSNPKTDSFVLVCSCYAVRADTGPRIFWQRRAEVSYPETESALSLSLYIYIYVGGCQNYGPFLDPYHHTAPNI